MRLNLQTDHALRLLMLLAQKPDEQVSVDTVAKHFSISRNHLAKTAQALVGAGFLKAERGRNGGLKLAMPAEQITVGQVIRAVENDTGVVECLQASPTLTCRFLPACRLKSVLSKATQAFLDETDAVTVASLVDFRKQAPTVTE